MKWSRSFLWGGLIVAISIVVMWSVGLFSGTNSPRGLAPRVVWVRYIEDEEKDGVYSSPSTSSGLALHVVLSMDKERERIVIGIGTPAGFHVSDLWSPELRGIRMDEHDYVLTGRTVNDKGDVWSECVLEH